MQKGWVFGMATDPVLLDPPREVRPWDLERLSAELRGDGGSLFRPQTLERICTDPLDYPDALDRICAIALDTSTMKWVAYATGVRSTAPDVISEAEIEFPAKRIVIRNTFRVGNPAVGTLLWGLTTADYAELDGCMPVLLDAMRLDLWQEFPSGATVEAVYDSFHAPSLLPDEHTFVWISGKWHDLTATVGVRVLGCVGNQRMMGVRIRGHLAHQVVSLDIERIFEKPEKILDPGNWQVRVSPPGSEQITHAGVSLDHEGTRLWLTYTAVSQECILGSDGMTRWARRVYTGEERFAPGEYRFIYRFIPKKSDDKPVMSMRTIDRCHVCVRLYGLFPMLGHLTPVGG